MQLALVEKARRVFSTGADTFLSIPTFTTLTMSPAALAAVAAPTTTPDYAAASDFARLVNFIPRDLVATIDSGRTLWEIYGEVLEHAQVGSGITDPVAEQRFRDAAKVLWADDPDGVQHESEAYRAYRQYRDAWIVANEDYHAKRMTAEASEDSAVRQQWHSLEPVLRAHLASIEADWFALGQRARVEAALEVLNSVSAGNPVLRWENWRAGFNPDLDLVTGPGGPFAPTGYSPVNLDDAAWSRFELSAAEIAQLTAEAPEELQQALHDDPAPVSTVAFDYRSVALTRPWFAPAALTSRIWRLPEGEPPLSDGKIPPDGQCPAYVSAIVLMRRLEVHHPPSPGSGGPGTVTHDPLIFKLPLRYLTKRPLPFPDPVEAGKWRQRTRELRQLELSERTVIPSAGMVNAFKSLAIHTFRTTESTPLLRSELLRHSNVSRTGALAHHFHLADDPVSVVLPGDPPPAPPDPPAEPPNSDVTILAFICKRLPKTPDPLPTIQW